MVGQDLTASGRLTDDTAASGSTGRPPAVRNGSDPVLSRTIRCPPASATVANTPRGRIAPVGQHMAAGADREPHQRFSRARPLDPHQLEEVHTSATDVVANCRFQVLHVYAKLVEVLIVNGLGMSVRSERVYVGQHD